MVKKIILAISLTLISGCSLIEKTVEKPKAEFKGISVKSLSLDSAQVVLELQVENPNPFALNVKQVEYKLKLNGQPITDGKTDQAISLPEKSKAPVQIPLNIPFKTVFGSIFDASKSPKTEYQIDGSASIGPLNIPFSKKGELDWSEELKKLKP